MTDTLTAPLPQPDTGNRGVQPEGVVKPYPPPPMRARTSAPRREYRCDRGHLLIRAILETGSEVECWCDRCKRHVVFVAT